MAEVLEHRGERHDRPDREAAEAPHHHHAPLLQVLRADARTRAIPVIAVTASAMTQDRQKIMAAGFDAYQAKPIDVTQFVAAVRAMLDRPTREGGGR